MSGYSAIAGAKMKCELAGIHGQPADGRRIRDNLTLLLRMSGLRWFIHNTCEHIIKGTVLMNMLIKPGLLLSNRTFNNVFAGVMDKST
jgi:hypothetical protein